MNVRAKGRGVNSVFLVQLRKMFATDFRGSARIVNLVEEVTLSRTEGAGSVWRKCGRRKIFVQWRGWIVHTGVHRKCRKAVVQ